MEPPNCSTCGNSLEQLNAKFCTSCGAKQVTAVSTLPAKPAPKAPADMPTGVIPENAVSVANRNLPAVPSGLAADAVTLCLMYQYVEPVWSNTQHRASLKYVINLAKKHAVTGRGRCAPEGLNCTLTGSAKDIRLFCYGLREWKPDLFNETDFKLTDGLLPKERFSAFTLQKQLELVNYGLEGKKAPSLKHHSGQHVEATEYHKMMCNPDAVIIDVRNAYESAIGHFQPPAGGAQLIDPKMRNSSDFPKWLNAPETQEKLAGKEVLMYCTGGIRCERATALLNQMTEATAGFDTKGKVTMVRGGIERYLKTFPEGGYWKGKNFLFDKRKEQVPEAKSEEALAADVDSKCCVCLKTWATYRGKYKCGAASQKFQCGVPVMVCPSCDTPEMQNCGSNLRKTLRCPLCVEGYMVPSKVPDLIGQKRQLGVCDTETAPTSVSSAKRSKKGIRIEAAPSNRLFIGHIPQCMSVKRLKKALRADLSVVDWLVDHETGQFYGSAFVQLPSVEQAKQVVDRCSARSKKLKGIKFSKKSKPLDCIYAPLLPNEEWPRAGFTQLQNTPL